MDEGFSIGRTDAIRGSPEPLEGIDQGWFVRWDRDEDDARNSELLGGMSSRESSISTGRDDQRHGRAMLLDLLASKQTQGPLFETVRGVQVLATERMINASRLFRTLSIEIPETRRRTSSLR